MKITTRVIWGYAVLVALLSSALVYEAIAIHQVQVISGELSQITFRAAEISLKLIRQRDLVDEFCRKFFAIQDPQLRDDYRVELRNLRENFESILSQVDANAGSTGEKEAIGRATADWVRFTNHFVSLTAPGVLQPLEIPAEILEDLEILRNSVEGINKETLRPINAAVARARGTAVWARRVSWIVSVGALLIGAVVCVLIMRSVSRPLHRLTEGTRAVADGDFSYRLSNFEDDEFRSVARDFNLMAQRLNELDQMKKDFVSHVSHEMKSPLASMRETIELLLEGIPGNLTDRQRRLLQLNLQSNRRLSSMIENLLDLSRMEAGVMEYDLKNQDLAPLIQTAVAEFELPAQEKQLQVRCKLPDKPVLAPCDGDRIIQVMSNLVGNAVKFSPPGSTVEIRVAHGSEDATRVPSKWLNASTKRSEDRDFWTIEVADRGPGVPDAAKADIFERFRQVKSGAKAPGQGTGLGLAICRTIVTAHGGKIWVDDNPGGGSCFRFVVPCLHEGETGRHIESSPI